MAIRHLAAELKHKQKQQQQQQQQQQSDNSGIASRRPISVFALHPGEVATDMAANVDVPWTVEGVLSVRESVEGCLRTIEARVPEESGTFWTWEGKVSLLFVLFCYLFLCRWGWRLWRWRWWLWFSLMMRFANGRIRNDVLMRCVAGISLVSSSLAAATKGSEAGVVAKRHDIACRCSRLE